MKKSIRSYPSPVCALLALTLLFSACSNRGDEKGLPPPNVLTEDQFAAVLADFALAESASNLNILNATPNKMDSLYAFNPLRDHGVRKAQYDSTIRFYSEQPALYKRVYELALVKITELETARRARADSAVK